MSKYFSVNGYFKDDKSEFVGYIIKEFDDAEEDEERDDQIFYYGLSEGEIQKMIVDGEDNGNVDFVITSYKEIDFNEGYNDYEIVLTFGNVASKSPMEATKQVLKWIQDGADRMIYEVTNEQTKEEFLVDLSEDDADAVQPKHK